jgi:hypothetical protein
VNHDLWPTEIITLPSSREQRRSFLRSSALGMAGLGVIGRSSAVGENAATLINRPETACIVFFLDGGPSHHDTFDPKPDAPAEVRGEFGVIETSVPGIRVSDQLPLLARHAEHFSLLRSLYHGNPSHAPAEHQMLTGWMGSRPGTAIAVIENPSLGSIVSRMRGPRRDGLPAYVAVPWSFHHAYGGSPFGAASYLGARYEPFDSGHLPNTPTGNYEVPELKLPPEMTRFRLRNRRELLEQLERFRRRRESPSEVNRARALTDEALDMLLEPRVRQAFDLEREPVTLRERYGSHEWGQGALLSRRLIEAGVTFVMLQCGLRQDWDTHDKNFVKLQKTLLPALDRAVSALFEDLARTGLLEKTLVIVMGEFGRTPIINNKAGRDHWANVFSALVAGGGLKGGQVIGSSDKTGAYPHEKPRHATDLFATMYHVLGIDTHTIFKDRQARPVSLLGQGTLIAELF